MILSCSRWASRAPADFRGSEKLGIRAIAPRDFLAMLKTKP